MSKEINNCPFCHSINVIFRSYQDAWGWQSGLHVMRVECMDCSTQGPKHLAQGFPDDETRKEAIDHWNSVTYSGEASEIDNITMKL